MRVHDATPAVPFPVDEYRQRAVRVRAEMERRGVDVLYVTSPPNIHYRTGLESFWSPPRAPLGVVLDHESEELVFVDYERHRTLASTQAFYDDAVWFTYETALETIAEAFAGRGWTSG